MIGFGDQGVNGPKTTAAQRIVAILRAEVAEHFKEVPCESRGEAFYMEVAKMCGQNGEGALKLSDFLKGIRQVLKVPESDMSDEDVGLAFSQSLDPNSKDEDSLGALTASDVKFLLGGGGARSDYQGHFVDCDPGPDGKNVETHNIWSTDVASKWLEKIRNKEDSLATLVPTALHTKLLRACNLQAVLREALSMNPDIAFKTSKSTIALKIES